MELATIDFIIIGLILFLSIKGIVTGFTHEILNFIGLVGGFAVATRVDKQVGEIINSNIYPIESEPTLKLVGLIATLLAIWLIFSFISSIINRAFSNDISILSRLLGYIVSIARYIAIFSLIFVAINKSDFLSEKLSKHYENSKITPLFNQVGLELLNSHDDNITKKVDSTKNLNLNDINLSAIDLDSNMSQK